MRPSFGRVVTLGIFFISTGDVGAFRVKTLTDRRAHGYVDVVVNHVTYPPGRLCFKKVSGGRKARLTDCVANLRVCLFTNTTTNLTKQQRQLHRLCRSGDGKQFLLPYSEVTAIESDNDMMNETSPFAFSEKAGELPFVEAFPERGWLNLVVSVALVKGRPWPSILRTSKVLYNGVGVVVSTRLFNTTTSSSKRVVVHNQYCESPFVLLDRCEPLLTFNITWRVRCAPGFDPDGRCAHFNKLVTGKRPFWTHKSLFPYPRARIFWTTIGYDRHNRHQSKRSVTTTMATGFRPSRWTYAPTNSHPHPFTTALTTAVSQQVNKSSPKDRNQSRIAIALGIPLAFIALALIACATAYIVNSCRKVANGDGNRGNRRLLFQRTASKSAQFLDSESVSDTQRDDRWTILSISGTSEA